MDLLNIGTTTTKKGAKKTAQSPNRGTTKGTSGTKLSHKNKKTTKWTSCWSKSSCRSSISRQQRYKDDCLLLWTHLLPRSRADFPAGRLTVASWS